MNDSVIVPTDPDRFETAVLEIAQIRQGGPDVSQDTSRHIPNESFELVHPSDCERDQRAQHLALLFVCQVLLHPGSGSIA